MGLKIFASPHMSVNGHKKMRSTDFGVTNKPQQVRKFAITELLNNEN